MSERMTSRTEADLLRDAIETATEFLESQSLDRGQIGAAMVGIGGAMLMKHSGPRMAAIACDGLRDALEAHRRPRQ